jgi:hypothetical protein
MTPRTHRRRSSKENQAQRCNLSEVAAPRQLTRLLDCFTQPPTAACPALSGWCFAYGYPSRHPGGAAIGR